MDLRAEIRDDGLRICHKGHVVGSFTWTALPDDHIELGCAWVTQSVGPEQRQAIYRALIDTALAHFRARYDWTGLPPGTTGRHTSGRVVIPASRQPNDDLHRLEAWRRNYDADGNLQTPEALPIAEP